MGGSGFTGYYLYRELRENLPDSEIIIADIIKSDFKESQYVKCDFSDSNQIHQLLDRFEPEYIFYLAGIFKSDNIMQSISINALGIAHTCEYYKRKPEKTSGILVVGSSAQYGTLSLDNPIPSEKCVCNPRSLYGWTKLMQEKIGQEYYRKYSIPVFFTRTANIIGPGQPEGFVAPFILKQVLQNVENGEKPVIKLKNINAGRDFLDVRDAVRVYVKLVTKPDLAGEIFNVGSGKVTFLKQVIEEIRTILDIEDIVISAEMSRTPDIHVTNCDKIMRALNWNPRFGLKETIKDMITYMQNNN